MVRLKVFYQRSYRIACFQISIPYGAIKRIYCLHALHIFLKISIPYGAIKRHNYHLLALANLQISIPYGAIKSLTALEFLYLLKDFNSLWCD